MIYDILCAVGAITIIVLLLVGFLKLMVSIPDKVRNSNPAALFKAAHDAIANLRLHYKKDPEAKKLLDNIFNELISLETSTQAKK